MYERRSCDEAPEIVGAVKVDVAVDAGHAALARVLVSDRVLPRLRDVQRAVVVSEPQRHRDPRIALPVAAEERRVRVEHRAVAGPIERSYEVPCVLAGGR